MTLSPTDAVLAATDWMLVDPSHTPALLAAVLRLDLPDTYPTASALAGDPVAAAELIELARLHPGRWDQDAAELVATIGLVGAAIWANDVENVSAWALVARRGLQLTVDAKTWPYRTATSRWKASTGPQIVAAFFDAGRGPSYANDMLSAAERARLAPGTFGYGDGITPAVLVALAAAGIHDQEMLDPYLDAGLSVEDATKLAERKVTPDALAWARGAGVPAEQWETLAGIPNGWFPDASGYDRGRGGLVAYGYTLADMRFLVENGWESMSTGVAHTGLRFGSGRYTGRVTPAQARALTEVGAPAEIESWMSALVSGKGGTGVRDAALPPLMNTRSVEQFREVIRALLDAGLRPSHLNTYRAAGCRTVDDVLKVAAAGVTPKRAKELLEAHGTRTDSWRPLRLVNVAALLAAHRNTPTANEPVQNTTSAVDGETARPLKRTKAPVA